MRVWSLRVKGVPGVLRLDSRDRLSLHVHWAGTDPGPVLPSQVSQELRVPVFGNIALVKPGCLTGCGRGKSDPDNLSCSNGNFSIDSGRKNKKITQGLQSNAVAKN